MGQRLVHGHGVVIFVDLVEVPRVRLFRVLEEIESQTALLLPATGRVDLQGLEEGGHLRGASPVERGPMWHRVDGVLMTT